MWGFKVGLWGFGVLGFLWECFLVLQEVSVRVISPSSSVGAATFTQTVVSEVYHKP